MKMAGHRRARASATWKALLMLALLAGCTPKEPSRKAESRSPRAPAQENTSKPLDGATEGSLKSPLPLGLQIEKSAGGIGLHVLSRGPEQVELAAAVAIEPSDAKAERVPQALTLRAACRQEGCLKLSAGGELLAPVWLGLPEGERCDALFVPNRPGEYLVTVKSCDGTRSAEARFFWNGP
jgi:hypothetical protein